ncbi:MAG: hypothetical protein CMK74_03900 [Pseudomonadales bacterium]|nr:hypothetical protein [Pseudomonadales bacterium]|tara:strand:- start:328 stop:1032 length:705 start_codon:yes stop_codon:yes gene_type:complete
MAVQQHDIFGEEFTQTVSPVRKPTTIRKSSTKLVINRRALWSAAEFLPGITEAEDKEDALEAASTTATYSDNSTIERLEKALGMSPVIRNGEWVTDALGFKYKLKGSPFKGDRCLGVKGSLVRDLNRTLVLTSARNQIEGAFNDPCSWLVVNSIAVLSTRLRMMADNEDPFACLQAFLEVMLQQDFIDNSRKGETIRNLAKRDRMREVRAERRLQKEQIAGSSDLDASLNSGRE